jgi:hypothetical protein
VSYEKEQMELRYSSARELLHSIKNIGAHTSFSSHYPLTRSNLIKLEDHYRSNFNKENSLYSTWEVLYFICHK